jgi:allantoinase
MSELADASTTLMFHAEMIPPITASVGDDVQHSHPPLAPSGPLNHYSTFLDSRPPSFETYAIAEILSLAHTAPKLPLHIVHLSAVEAIPLLREARANGINVTAETCFHYLSLAAEAVRTGDTRHKCCPPIRSQANQDGLWAELMDEESGNGVIRTVVSDHSPCTPNLKLLPGEFDKRQGGCGAGETVVQEGDEGDFFAAWGGISSVGLGLPILWTEGCRRDIKFGVEEVVRWCCRNTAKQVGLERTKGDLGVGFDGDVVVFDDEASFVVRSSPSCGGGCGVGDRRLMKRRSNRVRCSSATSARRTKTKPSRASFGRHGSEARRSFREKRALRRRADRLGSCCLSRGSTATRRKAFA